MTQEDIICAISTSPGRGAIAVIRVSGKGCIELCDSIFFSPSGKILKEASPNTVHFGQIRERDELVDEVLVSVFRAPHSYTGEDSVEISCHGSIYIQQRILQVLIHAGARMAHPGEYTQRAFLNGKMDLAQAEGVADLIASSSSAAHRMAMNQMKGGFSSELTKLREELLRLASLLELELDFSEEDVEFADRKELRELAAKIDRWLTRLCDSFSLGNVIKNGVPVAIVGNTNVGKSTLLNALLREERAIVSDVAGTTRDTIEETLNLDGVTFRFVDTAGIRNTNDQVEAIGIERTFSKTGQAKIVLLLVDATKPVEEIIPYYEQVRKNLTSGSQLIVLLNKVDCVDDEEAVLKQVKAVLPKDSIIPLSAKKGKYIPELEQLLVNTVQAGLQEADDVVVSNVRHYEALLSARKAIRRATEGLSAGVSGEFISQDIRECIHYLGEITGVITNDAILGFVFKHFCIGK